MIKSVMGTIVKELREEKLFLSGKFWKNFKGKVG